MATANYYAQPAWLTTTLIIGSGILGAILAAATLGAIEIAIANHRHRRNHPSTSRRVNP